MRFRIHLGNPALFAALWVALSALVLHDIALRRAAMHNSGTGTAVSERVVTKEFVLVDDSGRTRARIGMSDKTNAPCVQLFDTAGSQRAQLRLNKDDVPSLRLYDANGKVKSVMGFTLNDGLPSYVTFDANGSGHVENTTRPDVAYAHVTDEDLMSQYVTSNYSTINVYSGQVFTPQKTGTPYQIQIMGDKMRVRAEETRAQAEQAREAAHQAQQQAAQEAEQSRQEVERVNQDLKAQTAAIRAEADALRVQSPHYR